MRNSFTVVNTQHNSKIRTVSGLEKKQMSAILEFHFGIQSKSYHRLVHFMTHCIWITRFYPNCTIVGGVMMSYQFSRWRPLWRNFTSGFGFGDITKSSS